MKLYYLLVIIFSFYILTYSQKLTSVQGKFVDGTTEKTIFLENFSDPKIFSLQSPITNNSFSFQFNLDKENIFKLKLNNGNFFALIIKPGEKVQINIYKSDRNFFPEIYGSEQSQKIYTIESQLARYKYQQDSINMIFSQNNPTQNPGKEQLVQLYYQIEYEKNNYLANAIGQQPADLANIFFIERLNIDQYFPLYNLVDSMLYHKYKYIPAVEFFHQKVASSKKTAIGSKAPDIELPTPEGKKLSLYSLTGKIFIIDFWASWCGPCRKENPNMVKLYEEFKDKGLVIFGVSLDSDSLSWVRAIQVDKLNWYHVSDLKKWNSSAAKLYGVNSIPSTFILDENKIIIAKNLRGEQLRQFIAQKLKSQ
ncbi:MAG: TlpA family protein disulfide reductase [Bacteroidales bacterium]|nr:TlpA family protein disulfide reductase [Bacteroidales bacterium]